MSAPGRSALWGLCAAALASVGSAFATAEPAWKARYYNPQPHADDLILPMPCGGAVVFQPIRTPHSSNALADLPVTIGDQKDKFEYLRGPRRAYVSGNFGDGGSDDAIRHFYIAKYEIAVVQFDVVMNDECPKKTVRKRAFIAATGMSWFDSVEFTRRYTEWLWREAPDALPVADGARAFVRLPTEAEWEFVARGGAAVDDLAFRKARPPIENGQPAEYAAFGDTTSANGVVQPIGSLKPNVLNVHDMLGNAAEMMMEPFQLNRHGRMHGMNGAFIVKGGDARTPLNRLTSGARTETPFFDAETGSASTSEFTGFRLALGSVIISSTTREQTLREDYVSIAAADIATDAGRKEADALALLDQTVGTNTNSNNDLREQIDTIKRLLREARAEKNQQRDRAVRNQIFASATNCQQIRVFAQTANFSRGLLEGDGVNQGVRQSAAEICASDPASCDEANQYVQNIEDDNKRAEDALSLWFSYYGTLVESLATEYGPKVLDEQFKLLRKQQATRGTTRLLSCINLAATHVDLRRVTGRLDTSKWRRDMTQM